MARRYDDQPEVINPYRDLCAGKDLGSSPLVALAGILVFLFFVAYVI